MWGALGRTPLVLLAVLASGSLVDAVEEKCYCSGVASQCREATSYYWATLRQAFRLLGWTIPKSSIKCWTLRLQAKEEEHGFKLTDKEQQEEMEVEYQPESRYHPAWMMGHLKDLFFKLKDMLVEKFDEVYRGLSTPIWNHPVCCNLTSRLQLQDLNTDGHDISANDPRWKGEKLWEWAKVKMLQNCKSYICRYCTVREKSEEKNTQQFWLQNQKEGNQKVGLLLSLILRALPSSNC